MSNGNEKRRIPWVDVSFRSVLMAAVLSGAGLAYDNNEHTARLDERMMAHVDTHPDTNLGRRIDELNAEILRLRRRLNIMERRLGSYENDE